MLRCSSLSELIRIGFGPHDVRTYQLRGWKKWHTHTLTHTIYTLIYKINESEDKNKRERWKRWNQIGNGCNESNEEKKIIFVLSNWKLLEISWIKFDFKLIAFCRFSVFLCIVTVSDRAGSSASWKIKDVLVMWNIAHSEHSRTPGNQNRMVGREVLWRCVEHLCPVHGATNNILCVFPYSVVGFSNFLLCQI